MIFWIPIAEQFSAIYAQRPTYVNCGNGRASDHIPDVVYIPYGRRRRGCQHHLARHPRFFSTAVSPRKTLFVSFYMFQIESELQAFKTRNCNASHLLRFLPIKIFLIYSSSAILEVWSNKKIHHVNYTNHDTLTITFAASSPDYLPTELSWLRKTVSLNLFVVSSLVKFQCLLPGKRPTKKASE